MIWKGQYRAVMAIIFVVAIMLSMFISSSLGVGIILLQSFVFMTLWIVDIVMKAFWGKPLFYDIKVM